MELNVNPQLRQLRNLVKQGEGQRLEFKRKANHPEKIMREVCAFANSEGGILLVGVEDNGKIYGLKDYKGDEYVLGQAFIFNLSPQVEYHVEILEIDNNHSVLKYEIMPSYHKPIYHYEYPGSKPIAYVRNADKSIKASVEMLRILKSTNDPRGTNIVFGEKEKQLMQRIDEKKQTNVDDFAQYAGVNRRWASNLLVKFTRAGILSIFPNDKGDIYKLKEEIY
jgi:predicted HTH transcriptional regulator